MGTDIHGRLRYKRWSHQKDYNYVELPTLFDDRDYDFFAIIGNVRNGYGFAGNSRYENPVEPITNNRGLPEDEPNNYNYNIKTEEETEIYYGDHSYSYVTLKELKETKLHLQKVIRVGYFNITEYEEVLKGKTPTTWCGDVSGGNVEKITPEQYSKNEYDPNKSVYIFYKWEDQPFKEKIEKLICWMECYKHWNSDGSDEVLIFGFDS